MSPTGLEPMSLYLISTSPSVSGLRLIAGMRQAEVQFLAWLRQV